MSAFLRLNPPAVLACLILMGYIALVRRFQR